MLHPLLSRQLRRCGTTDPAQLDPAVWPTLLDRISRTYREFEEGHYLLERSLSISSEEMLQLNRSLHDSKASLLAERDTFESIGDGLCVLDRDGTCLSLNAAATRLLGWDEAEALGSKILDSISDPSLLKQVLDGDLRQDDARFRRKNGSTFPVAFVLTRIVREGVVRGVVLVFRDIAELKDVHARLAREHDQLLAVIATAPVSMAMFDRGMRYLAYSRQWLKDLELEGRNLVGLLHYDVLPDLPLRFRGWHRRALAGEVLSNPEEQFTLPDGATMSTRWAMQPWRTQEGEIGGIIVVFARIDDLVQARQEAIETARLKAQFLANMSHEIRTPMNGVLGMSELLLDTPLSDDQREFVQTIRLSAESLLSIVNDILDFSKIEAGKLRVESADFDVRAITDEATRVLAGNALRKGLEFTCAIVQDVPSRVRGDAGRLRQVLTNLVGNAVKFTESGKVGVRLRLAGRSAGSIRLRFEIADSGIGIAPETIDRLFRAFSQVDGSSTRRHGGTGLGLAISKQLVELMGGELGVESEPGVGSTFWFEVEVQAAAATPAREERPLLPAPASAQGPDGVQDTNPAQMAARAPLPSPKGTPSQDSGEHEEKSEPGPTLLLAEDNAVNCKVIGRMLQKLGCKFQVAVNGREALDRMETGSFDGVLMDCQMPVMDGLEAVARIRELESVTGRHIPVIAITAHAMVGDRERCLAAGMDDYLTKPFRLEELAGMLRRWCRLGARATA